MILVDSRAGSCELVKPLREAGLPVDETTLEFGDLAFMGRGEAGAKLFVGVEHKKLPDLLQSLDTERLQGHQLLGMLNTYDRRWLLVEGDWTHDHSGAVALWKGKGQRRAVKGAPRAIELEKMLLTIEARGGITLRMCPTRRDTVRFLTALYRFWTDKNLDAHKSHLAMYAPDLDQGLFSPPTPFRKALAVLLPGVHTTVSAAIERETNGPNVTLRARLQKVLGWTASDWAGLLTVGDAGKARRLGEKRAAQILAELNG